MYLYVIFGVLAIFAFFDVLIERDKRPAYYRVVFTAITLCLFVLSAFRLERGTDWITYLQYFKGSHGSSFDGWMEPGFTWFNQAVGFISHNYAVMIFVVSAIIYAIKPRIIYKLAPYPFVALLTWYAISLSDIFPVRQTIASALILYSVIFIIKREFVPFLIFVILATSIHATAFIFVIAYFLYSIHLNRSWCVILFVGSFLVAYFAQSIVSDMLGAISNPFIQERINSYLTAGSDETYGSIYSAKQVLIRGFINRGMIITIIFLLLESRRKSDKILNLWNNMFLFSSVFFAYLTAINVALSRLVIYFDLSQLFIFSYIFTLKMDRANKMLIYAIVALYLAYRFYGVISNYYDLYSPYKSLFWNSDIPVIIY